MILRSIIFVGLGGGIGSMLRYLTNVLVTKHFHLSFPLATFIVNMLGCLIIGILFGLFERHVLSNTDLRHLFITGFCGGFTTFSTFALENVNLFQMGNSWLAFMYIAGSVVVSLLFVWLGMRIVG